MRSLVWVWVAAFASHPADVRGRSPRQHATFRTAIGSLLTTLRTATPAQVQSWKARHQCSARVITTGFCVPSAVPMPFVPTALSDQQNHGARPADAAMEQ